MLHITLSGTREKQGVNLSVACKSDPHLRVGEMLPCNSLTVVRLQIKVLPFSTTGLFWSFAAFLNLVLNCLKGLHDWQLLGHMNEVLWAQLCHLAAYHWARDLLTCAAFLCKQ